MYNIEWKGSPNFRAQNNVKKEFIVFHWIVGTLDSATRIFQNASRKVATNYGVGEGRIHQYVKDGDYAFGSGTTHSNTYGISIEHEGGQMVAGKRKVPTKATLETSAWLCAKIARENGLGELIPGKNAFPHSKFVATACPGSLDWHWICAEANRINAGGTVTPPAVNLTPTLRLGSNGEAVKVIQTKLGIVVDGIFGRQTDAAVKAFQKSKGLLSDGIVGPITWRALNAVSNVEAPKPVVLKDPNKTQWKALQRTLKASWGYTGVIDGIPGRLTWSAVQRYLKAHFGYKGIIDGIPGPLTQAAWNRAGRTVK